MNIETFLRKIWKILKPKLFAIASQKANKSFNDTLKVIARKYGEITNSNKK